MRIQFFRLWAVLALLSCLSGAWGQSIKSQPVKTKGIDPALLANAKAGDAEAEFYLSLRYFDLGNQKESCRWVRAAAENGDAVAQVDLAGFYEFGSDESNLCAVAKDYAQAAFWYRKAANQGKPGAQFALGNLYLNGQGVSQDRGQAAIWFRKAALQGVPEAQFNLGLVYAIGEGTPQDYSEAAFWFRKAAEQGDASAQENLGTLYWDGRGVPQDYSQATVWWRKAAEQGNAAAQSKLGSAYGLGKGVSQDKSNAVVWFRKAADQGDADAQCALGRAYLLGEGLPQDYAEAYFWLDVAAAGTLGATDAEGAVKDRDIAASMLAPADLSRVQERARKWFEDHPAKLQ